MEIHIPEPVQTVLNELMNAGYESYVVGGCVRDSIMGFEPNDWDVTTAARPDEMKQVLKQYPLIETGIRHGTLTVLADRTPVEVTTFRIDGVYTDGRHPDSVDFTKNLENDLARRDFTINALAYYPGKGIVDCFGGMKDILRQRIRCVGEPDRRFQEDGLRILRALRFSSKLGFGIEPDTSESILRNAALLDLIAKERIRTDFVKLLCGKNVGQVLREYQSVIGRFLPELNAMVKFPQNNPYHVYDVWEHTLKALEFTPPTPVLRLAVLLHDIGKPSSYTQDENGVGHFYGHGSRSREMTKNILNRLRFDNASVRQITLLVEHHDISLPADEHILLRRLNQFGEENVRLLFQIKQADIHAQNPIYLDRIGELKTAKMILEQIIEQRACFSLKNLRINGADLIALGIPPGSEIGRILAALLEEVIEGACANRREALLQRAEEIRKK